MLSHLKLPLPTVMLNGRWKIQGIMTVAILEHTRLKSFGCISIYFIIFLYAFLNVLKVMYKP